jgi:putative FmdB family regulatory protein
MPIYEFECQQCGRHFETLVRGTTTLSCPSCQGTDLTRMLSVFAVGAKSTSGTDTESCNSCSHQGRLGSCCSMN